MKTAQPEFSRPFETARLPNSGANQRISADAKECKQLAVRMNLPAIHSLVALLLVKPWRGGGVKVTGRIEADIEQMSVISLDAFRSSVQFEVERYFTPSAGLSPEDEASDDVIDTLDGGTLDLGEIVSETLALELDPYPRKPGEVFGSSSETSESAEPSPFSVLSTPGKSTRPK